MIVVIMYLILSSLSKWHPFIFIISGHVTIDVAPDRAVRAVLEHLYMCKVTVDDNLQYLKEIVIVADYLQLSILKKLCQYEIIRYAKMPEHLPEILPFASQYHLREAENRAWDNIRPNMRNVIEQEMFMNISAELFLQILSEPRLGYVTAEEYYETLVKWVEYDKDERTGYFSKLFCALDLSRATSSTVEKIKANSMVAESKECTDVIRKSESAYRNKSSKTDSDGTERDVLVITGFETRYNMLFTNRVIGYVINENRWVELPRLPLEDDTTDGLLTTKDKDGQLVVLTWSGGHWILLTNNHSQIPQTMKMHDGKWQWVCNNTLKTSSSSSTWKKPMDLIINGSDLFIVFVEYGRDMGPQLWVKKWENYSSSEDNFEVMKDGAFIWESDFDIIRQARGFVHGNNLYVMCFALREYQVKGHVEKLFCCDIATMEIDAIDLPEPYRMMPSMPILMYENNREEVVIREIVGHRYIYRPADKSVQKEEDKNPDLPVMPNLNSALTFLHFNYEDDVEELTQKVNTWMAQSAKSSDQERDARFEMRNDDNHVTDLKKGNAKEEGKGLSFEPGESCDVGSVSEIGTVEEKDGETPFVDRYDIASLYDVSFEYYSACSFQGKQYVFGRHFVNESKRPVPSSLGSCYTRITANPFQDYEHVALRRTLDDVNEEWEELAPCPDVLRRATSITPMRLPTSVLNCPAQCFHCHPYGVFTEEGAAIDRDSDDSVEDDTTTSTDSDNSSSYDYDDIDYYI